MVDFLHTHPPPLPSPPGRTQPLAPTTPPPLWGGGGIRGEYGHNENLSLQVLGTDSSPPQPNPLPTPPSGWESPITPSWVGRVKTGGPPSPGAVGDAEDGDDAEGHEEAARLVVHIPRRRQPLPMGGGATWAKGWGAPPPPPHHLCAPPPKNPLPKKKY